MVIVLMDCDYVYLVYFDNFVSTLVHEMSRDFIHEGYHRCGDCGMVDGNFDQHGRWVEAFVTFQPLRATSEGGSGSFKRS